MLLEYLEQLVLLEELAQLRRVVHRRYAQQQPVKILLQPEQVQVGRVCEHRAVVIVVIPVNLVVRGVQAPGAFEQLDLRLRAQLAEYLDGLFRCALVAVDGQRHVNYFLHARPQAVYVVVSDVPPDVQVAVVAVRHGYVYIHFPVGIKVVNSLAEHEKEAPDVCPPPRCALKREELDVLAVVNAVMHPLNSVVHLGAHRAIVHFEPKFIIYLRKCASDANVFCFFIIFATDLYHLFHNNGLLGLTFVKLRRFPDMTQYR